MSNHSTPELIDSTFALYGQSNGTHAQELVWLVDTHNGHHGQMVIEVPFSVQIDSMAIGVAQVSVDGVVIEVQRANGHVLEG